MDIAVINVPFYDEVGFDTYVSEEKHRLFGVFDGMGTQEGARAAATMLANRFHRVTSIAPDAQGLGEIINGVSRALASSYPHNGSTATVARVDSKGVLHYASVGDSRLYVMRRGRIKQMTADEGLGNLLTNYVGAMSRGVLQIGEINPEDWDAFMLCTDGITGDWPEQFIHDQEIEELFDNPVAASYVCSSLVTMSKKEDDKTVIVVIKEK